MLAKEVPPKNLVISRGRGQKVWLKRSVVILCMNEGIKMSLQQPHVSRVLL